MVEMNPITKRILFKFTSKGMRSAPIRAFKREIFRTRLTAEDAKNILNELKQNKMIRIRKHKIELT